MSVSEVSSSWVADISCQSSLGEHVVLHDATVVDIRNIECVGKFLKLDAVTFDGGQRPRPTVEIRFSKPLRFTFFTCISNAKNVEIHGCKQQDASDIHYLGTTRSHGMLSRNDTQLCVCALRFNVPVEADYIQLKFVGVAQPADHVLLDSVHLSGARVPEPLPVNPQPVRKVASPPRQHGPRKDQQQLEAFALMARTLLQPSVQSIWAHSDGHATEGTTMLQPTGRTTPSDFSPHSMDVPLTPYAGAGSTTGYSHRDRLDTYAEHMTTASDCGTEAGDPSLRRIVAREVERLLSAQLQRLQTQLEASLDRRLTVLEDKVQYLGSRVDGLAVQLANS